MDRQQTEAWELKYLKPYASFSAKSHGRKHKEPEDEIRTAFQRDRDRIIHSSAFRRLEYKTQVFVYHEGDYFRTRLTHTIEVAQIARTIARSLGVNEDLTEAVALAHDMGHPPFGHSGEKTLDELLKDDGGFNHNLQSLKIVEELEKKYPNFPGLNLTYEVREGLAKHSTEYDVPGVGEFAEHPGASLEAQVVDIADEIAYNSHDIDDGLASGMIDEADIASRSPLARDLRRGREKLARRGPEGLAPCLRFAAHRTAGQGRDRRGGKEHQDTQDTHRRRRARGT